VQDHVYSAMGDLFQVGAAMVSGVLTQDIV